MDFMNTGRMEGEETPELPFAADRTAALTHLALQAALDSEFANFDDHSARHTRACEVATASPFDGAWPRSQPRASRPSDPAPRSRSS